jgi:hypothetical protein
MSKAILRIFIITIFILSIIIPLYLSSQIVTSQPTQPNPLEPSITMTLVHDTQLAEPDYSGYHHPPGAMYAEFSGVINAEINEATTVIVNLEATDTWSCSQVAPPSLIFDESDEKTFGVMVIVPKDEKYNTEGKVTINGFWSISPGGLSGTIEPVEGKIIVGQYSNFSLSSDNMEVLAKIGSETKFKLNIRNHGNYHDSFLIKINNLAKLENKSIDIRLDSPEIFIRQGFTESVTFYVKPNQDLSLLKPELELEVSSFNGTLKGMKPKTHEFTLITKKKILKSIII